MTTSTLRLPLLLAATASALLCAACASNPTTAAATPAASAPAASTAATTGTPPRPAGGHGLAATIGSYDANRDGTVTRAEMDAVRLQRFQHGDTNGDGWLSEAEYVAEYETRLKQQYFDDGKEPDDFYTQAVKQASVRFAIVDRDRNGQYTLEEDRAVGERVFAQHDTNGDGVISRDDPPRERPARNDADDGKTN